MKAVLKTQIQLLVSYSKKLKFESIQESHVQLKKIKGRSPLEFGEIVALPAVYGAELLEASEKAGIILAQDF